MTNVLGDCIGTKIVEVISQKELKELARLAEGGDPNLSSISPGPSDSPIRQPIPPTIITNNNHPNQLPSPIPIIAQQIQGQSHMSVPGQMGFYGEGGPQMGAGPTILQMQMPGQGLEGSPTWVEMGGSGYNLGLTSPERDAGCDLTSVAVSGGSMTPSPLIERQTNL